jgi:CDK-activating kinase assembly factor MAT1
MRSDVKDEPHIPLTDDWYAHQDKFVLREQYGDPGTDGLLRDVVGSEMLISGGYDIREAWERAIRTSVAGLAVQPIADSSPAGVPTLSAG